MSSGSPEALALYNEGVDFAESGNETAAAASWEKALGFEPAPGLEAMIRRNLVIANFRPLLNLPKHTTLTESQARSFLTGEKHLKRLSELVEGSLPDLDEPSRKDLAEFVRFQWQIPFKAAVGDWILTPDETGRRLFETGMALANSGKKEQALSLLRGALEHLSRDNAEHRPMVRALLVRCAALSNDLRDRESAVKFAQTALAEFEFGQLDTEHMILQAILTGDPAEALSSSSSSSESKSGCFIATAACGSSEAAEVQALRRFRDSVLLASAIGRCLVRFYEAVSPSLSVQVQAHPTLRWLVLLGLIRPVASLVDRERWRRS